MSCPGGKEKKNYSVLCCLTLFFGGKTKGKWMLHAHTRIRASIQFPVTSIPLHLLDVDGGVVLSQELA